MYVTAASSPTAGEIASLKNIQEELDKKYYTDSAMFHFLSLD